MKPGSQGSPVLRLGWWTAPLVIAVVAVNLAGVWEISAALRALRNFGERTLHLQTESRARAVESALAATTADLAFFVGSPSLKAAAASRNREDVGLALLLFLRGHAVVEGALVREPGGAPWVEAGRPRGVPGFWTPDPASDSPSPDTSGLSRRFDVAVAANGTVSLDVRLDPARLAEAGSGAEGPGQAVCGLYERHGARLAGEDVAVLGVPLADAPVADTGWAGRETWVLRCASPPSTAGAVLAPLVARQRMTVVLNLAVMVVAMGLGVFAYQQQRRRLLLEEQARNEQRVRELERQLFHAERLSTVGRLAAGMAHEINNPLEGIANYLSLALGALDGGDAGVVRRHVEGARHGVERAAGIVRGVLDHADPATSLDDEIDLREVASQAAEFVRSRDEFGGLDFRIETSADALPVLGNGVMLGQVFLNLLINACEAQPRGGEVVVHCRRRGEFAEVGVADRGPGVPESRRNRIFEPFESTKSSAGLGLSICHSIVEQHGGQLSVEEREGGGALFRVRLRLREEGSGGGA